jgi:hypothetical protein
LVIKEVGPLGTLEMEHEALGTRSTVKLKFMAEIEVTKGRMTQIQAND